MSSERYNPKKIQNKWQKKWSTDKIFQANLQKSANPFLVQGLQDFGVRPKFYNLMMFPYPSGDGLHVGHVYAFGGADTFGHFKKMQGFDVFEPMGFDSFGIHSENYAIKIGKQPQQLIEETTKYFREEQLQKLGALFDWNHEVITSDIHYYRWTQWLFTQLFKAGLAVRKKASVDWCPSCKTVLADEQVIAGKCERCNSEVVQKELEQWFFKITDYAERLLKNLEWIDWSETTKIMQKNWIGRSEGVEVDFQVKNSDLKLKIYTTRPDTIFGATFMVVSPEHPKIEQLISNDNKTKVSDYINKAKNKTEVERATEKTGIFTGNYATNPLTKKEIPIWIADYVLASYGTGAIMAVPAHDQRDFEFAKKYELPIVPVIESPKKSVALLLHGTSGDNRKAWIPWLNKQLTVAGFEVIAPNLPDSEFPEFTKWQNALSPYLDRLDHNSVIVGHSLGGATAAQLILKNNKKVAKLLLVAPTFPDMDWNAYKGRDSDKNVKNIENVSKELKNWSNLKDLVSETSIFYSEDDKYIPVNEVESTLKSKLPWAKFIKFQNKSHFNHGSKIFELPEAISRLLSESYEGEGKLTNSEQFNGLSVEEAKKKISDYIETNKLGSRKVNFHLRDWLISRQRYWGPPIPMIYCESCAKENKSWFTTSEAKSRKSKARSQKSETKLILNSELKILNSSMKGWYPVAEENLPVELPKVEDYQPKGTGVSPLAAVSEFVNVACPQCGKEAKRETDVSDTFLDSSWYFLRYPSVGQESAKVKLGGKEIELPWNSEITKKWLPVDMYIGGNEHAVLHLLYSRFITMALADMGFIDFEEPFKKFRAHALIIYKGAKMSKSRGNVINPNEYIDAYGSDALKMYLLFIGPYDQGGEFNDRAILGVYRFLSRVWTLVSEEKFVGQVKPELVAKLNKLNLKLASDYENLHFNTAVASLMEFTNELYKNRGNLSREIVAKFLLMLAPLAPFTTEELWEFLGNKGSIHQEKWPEESQTGFAETKVSIVIQVNGKFRDKIEVEKDLNQEKVSRLALDRPKIKNYTQDKQPKKIIYVAGKLLNIVI